MPDHQPKRTRAVESLSTKAVGVILCIGRLSPLMVSRIARAIPVLAIMSPVIVHGAQSGPSCSHAGAPVWSDQTRAVLPDCPATLTSPSGLLTLSVSANGILRITDPAGAVLTLTATPVRPPAMASWAPDSSSFFVNDGQGSGMFSVLQFFRVGAGHVFEDAIAERRAVAVFRRIKGCGPRGTDPAVWGLGWSPDGKDVYLLAQAAVNEPCGSPGSFVGLILAQRMMTVVKSLTESATVRQFRSLLPSGLAAEGGRE